MHLVRGPRDRTKRVQTFENINGIGQLIIILAQLRGCFRTGAILFDLADLVLGQAVVVQCATQFGLTALTRCWRFVFLGAGQEASSSRFVLRPNEKRVFEIVCRVVDVPPRALVQARAAVPGPTPGRSCRQRNAAMRFLGLSAQRSTDR